MTFNKNGYFEIADEFSSETVAYNLFKLSDQFEDIPIYSYMKSSTLKNRIIRCFNYLFVIYKDDKTFKTGKETVTEVNDRICKLFKGTIDNIITNAFMYDTNMKDLSYMLYAIKVSIYTSMKKDNGYINYEKFAGRLHSITHDLFEDVYDND